MLLQLPQPARATRRLVMLTLATLAFGALAAPALAQSPPLLSVLAQTGAVGGMGADTNGNVYISDDSANQVDKVSPDGTVTVIAGTGSTAAPVPGDATSSPIGHPGALAVDPDGVVFVYDASHFEILEISTAGTLSIVAGTGTSGAPVAGPATASPMRQTQALAADASGNVYYQDADGSLWMVASDDTQAPLAGGPLPVSTGGMAVDSAGNLYLASNQLVEVSPSGTHTILAGTGTNGAPVAGTATSSPLGSIAGVGVDSVGNVYLADPSNNVVEKVTLAGALSIYAGTGTPGAPVAGTPTSSPVDHPDALSVDGGDTLAIASANRILRVGSVEPTAPRELEVTPGDGFVALLFAPPGNPGTTPIAGYQYSTDNGAIWHPLPTTPCSCGKLNAQIGGLVNGIAYAIVVRAFNSSGTSGPGPVVVTTLAPTSVVVAPPTPDLLTLISTLIPLAPAPTATTTTTATSRTLLVALRLRVPTGCRHCVISRATLSLRDRRTVLGSRSDVKVDGHGWVRFTIAVKRATLLAAPGKTVAGKRTLLTHLAFTLRRSRGASVHVTHDGRITVSLARIEG